ncbi:glycosyltransferase family 4 protein [Mailhella sp.]|uniref:glycosyltransferase family 4 protein n=1 Tax=Mailhella sp. TaxID=1981029 RepID=UPI004063340A
MKVLILVNSDWGAYRFRRQLVEALLARGDSVTLSCPDGPYAAKFEALGVKVMRQPVDRRGLDPVADAMLFFSYRSLMRREKPDAVFCYTVKPNIYGVLAARSLRIPCAATITGLGTALGKPGPLRALLIFLYRHAFRRVDTVFFQNIADRDFFQKHDIPCDKPRLAAGSGVDVEEFAIQPMPEQGGTVFLFAGRILREKGIVEFLKAARMVKERHPETCLLVAGPLEDVSLRPLVRQAHREGVITFCGFVDDMRACYAQAHCTVLPSYYPEGMSNVLLESAASGRAVISTARPGCGEAVQDGVSGFLVHERDAADLASAMERFLVLPPEEKAAMGLAARRRMELLFDRRTVTAMYLDALDSLTKRGLHGL